MYLYLDSPHYNPFQCGFKGGKSRRVFQALLPPKNKNQIANPKGLGIED